VSDEDRVVKDGGRSPLAQGRAPFAPGSARVGPLHHACRLGARAERWRVARTDSPAVLGSAAGAGGASLAAGGVVA
jgi:hypothetical protein